MGPDQGRRSTSAYHPQDEQAIAGTFLHSSRCSGNKLILASALRTPPRTLKEISSASLTSHLGLTLLRESDRRIRANVSSRSSRNSGSSKRGSAILRPRAQRMATMMVNSSLARRRPAQRRRGRRAMNLRVKPGAKEKARVQRQAKHPRFEEAEVRVVVEAADVGRNEHPRSEKGHCQRAMRTSSL